MKTSATPRLSWAEPTLFAARVRDRRGWTYRGLLALIIFAGMMAAFAAQKPGRGRAPGFSTPGAVALSLAIGVLFTAMLDAPDLDREVTISDDNINAFGNAGMHFRMTTISLKAVRLVRLHRPEEIGQPFGAMEVLTTRAAGWFGVPASLRLKRVAAVLHGLGISVLLADWQPAPPGEAEPAVAGAGTPAATGPVPTASARVERLDPAEAGQILTPFRYGVALALALGPAAVAIPAAAVLVVVFVYRAKIFQRLHSRLEAAEFLTYPLTGVLQTVRRG